MYREDRASHNWLIKKVLNDRMAVHVPAMAGKTVLDLGCGTRPFEPEIAKVAKRYIGIDWSNSIHGTHADIVADLNVPLPIRDSVADVVVSLEVLEHLREPQRMLQEAHRILKTGGKLILSAPFQWWVHEAPWDYYRYTRYGLAYMLDRAGFAGLQVEETTGFWETWLLKLNYQTLRLIRGPRLLQILMRACLVPFWWINQSISPLLSRLWPAPSETAGYFVIAFKG